MRLIPGQVAVVTGAASGIGRALCSKLAARGCDLALVDIYHEGLTEAAAALRGSGRSISMHRTDVSDRAAMDRLPGEVLRHHPGVHLLVNNAGVSLAGPFEDYELEDLDWIVGVNFWGVVHGCKYFLPHLRKESGAHIVNVGSDFGLLGFPTKTGYCATKFAVRGFSESLRAELSGSNVGLTCVYPGAVDTALVRNSRVTDEGKKKLEAHYLAERGRSPDDVARRIVRAVERNAARVLIGRETILIDLATRFFPRFANAMAGRFKGRVPFV